MLLDLLSATVAQGTGHAASLGIKAYGKTGTSQDNRDALFIGFADNLVVGVWVGNDDNSPLHGIAGGGVPARIWRDFMGSAIKGAAPPRPTSKPHNSDDVPLPSGIDDTNLQLGNDSSMTLTTDIGGIPINLKLDREGVTIAPPPEGGKGQP